MIFGAAGTEQFAGLLTKCADRLGIRRRVALKLSAAAATPAVCGLFRPVILLPAALVSRLSAAQMEAVLLHELAHVRRGDPWVNYGQALLQIFYFYNPLLWLANAAIRRVREEAVDELVLVALADAAALYPETLLQVAKFTMHTPRPGFGWVGILEKKSTVGGRIRLMLHRPWPKSARLGLRGGMAVVALAAVLLPMKSRTAQQGESAAPARNSSLERFREIAQNRQNEIGMACGAALTNILSDLQRLAQQYPPLTHTAPEASGSWSISAASASEFPPRSVYAVNGTLSYLTNGLYFNPKVPTLGSRGVALELGITTEIRIRPDDLPEMSNDLPLLLVGENSGFYYKYDLQLDSPDPAHEKAIKDIVEKQVGILRKSLQDIVGDDPVAGGAQASVLARSSIAQLDLPETASQLPPPAVLNLPLLKTGESQDDHFLQVHRAEIERACDLAVSNILRDLQGLGQQYAPLSDIGPRSLLIAQPPAPGDKGLEYSKNTRWVSSNSRLVASPGRTVIDQGGARLIVKIHNLDVPLPMQAKGADIYPDSYPLLMTGKKEKLTLIYYFGLNPHDPALEEVVKGIVEKQVGVLRTDLAAVVKPAMFPNQDGPPSSASNWPQISVPAPASAHTQAVLGSFPADTCAKLKGLFQKYYPAAAFTNQLADAVQFECEVAMIEVPADSKGPPVQYTTARGPKKGGIMCDVYFQKGQYLGQLLIPDGGYLMDKKAYKELFMAPYSAKLDAHFYLCLRYPPDASGDFLKEFDAIMKDFEKDTD